MDVPDLRASRTGAGKSMVIQALGAVLGAPAGEDIVRTGESSCIVEARLNLSHAAQVWLGSRRQRHTVYRTLLHAAIVCGCQHGNISDEVGIIMTAFHAAELVSALPTLPPNMTCIAGHGAQVTMLQLLTGLGLPKRALPVAKPDGACNLQLRREIRRVGVPRTLKLLFHATPHPTCHKAYVHPLQHQQASSAFPIGIMVFKSSIVSMSRGGLCVKCILMRMPLLSIDAAACL